MGVLITFLFALGAVGVGSALLNRSIGGFDPAARFGLYGLAGLGALGLLSLPICLLPGGTRWGIFVIVGFAIVGLGLWFRSRAQFALGKPEGLELGAVAVLALAGLFALLGAITPSLALDWDTLAYHLAVPKLWIASGKMESIPFIHQSNFPQVVDSLYIWGLQWGDQSGAKAFSVAFLVFGFVALFGLGRQEYGRAAGWWAALGLACVPLMVWEAGTAYIDVANGLYAGLGVYFVCKIAQGGDRSLIWPAALMLGFAAGSKYTGLQTIAVAGATVFLVMAVRRQAAQGLKFAALVGTLSLLIAAPWYARNIVWKGNPVFPFFYSKLGGKGWDQRRADVYSHEQNTFGVGRQASDPDPDLARNPVRLTRIGHSILGLAYQPGRYINPAPIAGQGMAPAWGGFALLGALFAWMISGKSRALEAGLIVSTLLSLFLWFELSQQSRYLTALAPPLALLLGAGTTRLPLGKLLAGMAGLQLAATFVSVYLVIVQPQLDLIYGKTSMDDYLKQTGFRDGAKAINALGPESKTALYDQVFGYLLDTPYVWANPGHSELIDYDSMKSAADYVAEMKKDGFTHIYVNVVPVGSPPSDGEEWLETAGLAPGPGYALDKRQTLFDGFETRYKPLIAEAIKQGRLVPVTGAGRWLLLRIP